MHIHVSFPIWIFLFNANAFYCVLYHSRQKNCKHHVSREALKTYFGRQAEKECPVFGCPGVWRRDMYDLDIDYRDKIQTFLRRERLQADLQTQSQSIALDD